MHSRTQEPRPRNLEHSSLLVLFATSRVVASFDLLPTVLSNIENRSKRYYMTDRVVGSLGYEREEAHVVAQLCKWSFSALNTNSKLLGITIGLDPRTGVCLDKRVCQ